MHFNQFFNMCEKCLSSSFCETEKVYKESIHLSLLTGFKLKSHDKSEFNVRRERHPGNLEN